MPAFVFASQKFGRGNAHSPLARAHKEKLFIFSHFYLELASTKYYTVLAQKHVPVLPNC